MAFSISKYISNKTFFQKIHSNWTISKGKNQNNNKSNHEIRKPTLSLSNKFELFWQFVEVELFCFSSPDQGDGFDDFARFQGGQRPAGAQPANPNEEYYDDEEDDDLNFEPQNGYGDEEDLEYDEQPEVEVKKKKERFVIVSFLRQFYLKSVNVLP